MAVTVGVRELRENLRRFLDRAQAGEEVVVTDRGRPVARIVPNVSNWDRMVAEGRLRPALKPKTPLKKDRPRVRGGIDDILREQRG